MTSFAILAIIVAVLIAAAAVSWTPIHSAVEPRPATPASSPGPPTERLSRHGRLRSCRGAPAPPAGPASARPLAERASERLGLGLRAEVGRLPLHRLRRRRRRPPPVAQRARPHPL